MLFILSRIANENAISLSMQGEKNAEKRSYSNAKKGRHKHDPVKCIHYIKILFQPAEHYYEVLYNIVCSRLCFILFKSESKFIFIKLFANFFAKYLSTR